MAIKKYLKYLWFYDTTAFLEQVSKRFRPVHLYRSRSKTITAFRTADSKFRPLTNFDDDFIRFIWQFA